jgi:hypothetical protein
MSNTELKVVDFKVLDQISFNYDELKQEISKQLSKYEGLIFDEKDIKEAKETRANLNRLKKQVNDKKIDVKKEFMKPYTEFENKIKDILEMIDKPCNQIDIQIKQFEQKTKDEKKNKIIDIFNDNIGELKQILNIQRIWNDRWLNATYDIKDIELEILGVIDRAKTDLQIIENMKSEFEIQLKDKYISSLDLSTVMQEKNRLETIKNNEEQRQNKPKQVKNTFDEILKNTKIRVSIIAELNSNQIEELRKWFIKNNISYESEEL